MIATISAILGTGLLLLGRKLFWLFVGVVGFGIGLQVTERLGGGADGPRLVLSLVVGILFAVLAIFLQTVAIGAAGFFGGGYVVLGIATMLGLDQGPMGWIAFLVGGILGAILIGVLFDWALIVLSSLAGASMIVRAFEPDVLPGSLLFLFLLLLGVAVQNGNRRKEHQQKRAE
jgi:hypothetical protein